MKILCFISIHNWQVIDTIYAGGSPIHMVECKHCKKIDIK